jgi:PKD repeat protein
MPAEPVNGELVTFTGTSDGSAPLTYAWDFGDGSGETGNPSTHTFTASGDYTVVFTVTNACGEASSTHVLTITQSCEPVSGADFTWLPLEPFKGDLITFTAAADGTQPIDFQWDFGDAITGTGATVTHVYAGTGNYTVELSTTNACGDDLVNKDITILQKILDFFLPLLYK